MNLSGEEEGFNIYEIRGVLDQSRDESFETVICG